MARRLTPALLMILCLGLAPFANAAPGDWQPGPEAILENTYAGVADSPVGGSTVASNQPVLVTGWVLDRTAEGWGGIDNVHVYDGFAGPGTFLGPASFAQSRPDVAQALGNPYWSNSGFSLTIPAGKLGPGAHTLTIYAHAQSKGWWWIQVSFTVGPAVALSAVPAVSTLPPPVNVILQPRGISIKKSQDRYTIKGYALDPNATSDTGIDRVDVYMDELRGRSDAKFIGTADYGRNSPDAANAYGGRFQSAGYQIDFKPGDFDPGNHHVYTYAHSSVTGKEMLDTAGFNITR